MKREYTIDGYYSLGETSAYGYLAIDGLDGRNVECGEVESGCDNLTLDDFREAGLLELVDPSYHDSDEKYVTSGMLRDDILNELLAAFHKAEADEESDMIQAEVDAHREYLTNADGTEDFVIDVCPRGFCNERHAIILPGECLEDAKKWIDENETQNWSAEILTCDEYCEKLTTALENADDPTTKPRAGVACLGSFNLHCNPELKIEADTFDHTYASQL